MSDKLEATPESNRHFRRNSIPLRYIPPMKKDGVSVCLNCGKPLPSRRRKYCSNKCANEFFVKHNFSLLKFEIFKRDKYTCQHCGYISELDKRGIHTTSYLECDHILAISLGGEEFDEKNLQTLCKECHKEKTKEDRALLHESKYGVLKKRKIYEDYWGQFSGE